MRILITGIAGFIGYSLAKALLSEGHDIIGLDNLNPFYSVRLKQKRLVELEKYSGFEFQVMDITSPNIAASMNSPERLDRIIHLAGHAGVRRSLEEPHAYITANICGHTSILEFCRRLPQKPLLIYASSSSVYGQGTAIPFCENADLGDLNSIYAISKQTNERLSQAYASLYGLSQIGLRLFTVYGPWGRPDMAYWLFSKNALTGEPLKLFNQGQMKRDFSYIDDVVSRLVKIATQPARFPDPTSPHQIFNIGSGRAKPLADLIEIIKNLTQKEIRTELWPMQIGDVEETCADLSRYEAAYGPVKAYTPLKEGMAEFMGWLRSDPEFIKL